MIQRRATAAGIATKISCHSFRATGITTYYRTAASSKWRSRWPTTNPLALPAYTLAATTLWAGPWLAPSFLTVVAFAGAAIALTWLTPLRRLMPAAPADLAAPEAPTGRARFAQPVPYGIAISTGGLYLAATHAFH